IAMEEFLFDQDLSGVCVQREDIEIMSVLCRGREPYFLLENYGGRPAAEWDGGLPGDILGFTPLGGYGTRGRFRRMAISQRTAKFGPAGGGVRGRGWYGACGHSREQCEGQADAGVGGCAP